MKWRFLEIAKPLFFLCSFATLFSSEAEGRQKRAGSKDWTGKGSSGGPGDGPPGSRGIRSMGDMGDSSAHGIAPS